MFLFETCYPRDSDIMAEQLGVDTNESAAGYSHSTLYAATYSIICRLLRLRSDRSFRKMATENGNGMSQIGTSSETEWVAVAVGIAAVDGVGRWQSE